MIRRVFVMFSAVAVLALLAVPGRAQSNPFTYPQDLHNMAMNRVTSAIDEATVIIQACERIHDYEAELGRLTGENQQMGLRTYPANAQLAAAYLPAKGFGLDVRAEATAVVADAAALTTLMNDAYRLYDEAECADEADQEAAYAAADAKRWEWIVAADALARRADALLKKCQEWTMIAKGRANPYAQAAAAYEFDLVNKIASTLAERFPVNPGGILGF